MEIKADKSFFKSTIIFTSILAVFSVFLDFILIMLFILEKRFFSDSSNVLFLLIVLLYNCMSFYRFYLAVSYYKKTSITLNDKTINVICLRPCHNKNMIEAFVAPFKLPVYGLYETSKYSYKPKFYSVLYKNIQKLGYAKDLNIKENNIKKDDIIIFTKDNKKIKQYVISGNQFKKEDLYFLINEIEKRTKISFNGGLSQFGVDQ